MKYKINGKKIGLILIILYQYNKYGFIITTLSVGYYNRLPEYIVYLSTMLLFNFTNKWRMTI
jgi:hypothetical protein